MSGSDTNVLLGSVKGSESSKLFLTRFQSGHADIKHSEPLTLALRLLTVGTDEVVRDAGVAQPGKLCQERGFEVGFGQKGHRLSPQEAARVPPTDRATSRPQPQFNLGGVHARKHSQRRCAAVRRQTLK